MKSRIRRGSYNSINHYLFKAPKVNGFIHEGYCNIAIKKRWRVLVGLVVVILLDLVEWK